MRRVEPDQRSGHEAVALAEQQAPARRVREDGHGPPHDLLEDGEEVGYLTHADRSTISPGSRRPSTTSREIDRSRVNRGRKRLRGRDAARFARRLRRHRRAEPIERASRAESDIDALAAGHMRRHRASMSASVVRRDGVAAGEEPLTTSTHDDAIMSWALVAQTGSDPPPASRGARRPASPRQPKARPAGAGPEPLSAHRKRAAPRAGPEPRRALPQQRCRRRAGCRESAKISRSGHGFRLRTPAKFVSLLRGYRNNFATRSSAARLPLTTEEARVLDVIERYEFKYLVPERLVPAIRATACAIGRLDRYAGPGGVYRIRSLYLDTRGFDLYWANAREQRDRFKLRVRTYPGKTSPAFLEVKRRVQDVIIKSRAAVPASEWRDLLAPGRPASLDRLPPGARKAAESSSARSTATTSGRCSLSTMSARRTRAPSTPTRA